MKYEQKVEVELQEYICLVKRIDGVVAQKRMEEELIRCKYCKYWGEYCGICTHPSLDFETCFECDENFYCGNAERKEE